MTTPDNAVVSGLCQDLQDYYTTKATIPVRTEQFRDRLTLAVQLWEMREGKEMDQATLGVLVGGRLGRKAWTQSSVSKWFRETEPALATIVAIAKTLDVDPGWLAFGGDSKAPPPTNPLITRYD